MIGELHGLEEILQKNRIECIYEDLTFSAFRHARDARKVCVQGGIH